MEKETVLKALTKEKEGIAERRKNIGQFTPASRKRLVEYFRGVENELDKVIQIIEKLDE